jgi:glycosyltransferase involved in cell wall biosynthesis
MSSRILVVSHASVLNVNRALYQELHTRGRHRVSMIVPVAWKGDLIRGLEFSRSREDGEIEIFPLPVMVSGNGSLFFYRAWVGAIMEKARPDFLFLDEEPWSLCAAQFTFRRPSGLKFAFYTKQNLRKIIPAPFRLLEQMVFRRSSAAFSVEPEVEDVLRWKGYGKKIYDLPHSFDPGLFHPPGMEKKRALLQSYGLEGERPLVMYCGRLTEEKGIGDLLAVAEAVGPAARYLFVGNGPLFAEVENFCRSRPYARCMPALKHHEIGAAMGCADILVLPSRTTSFWKEQFGRVLVEAMACGAAVLGSDSGAIARVIARAGGGLSYPEGDRAKFQERLLELVENPARLGDFKAQGLRYVGAELTHAVMAGKLEAAIDEILAGP